MQLYSLVFIPSGHALSYLQSKKDALFNLIGWYPSRNAIPHITVLNFVLYDAQLQKSTAYLERFCAGIHPFQITFDRLETLGNALCYLPSGENKATLEAVTRNCAVDFPFRRTPSYCPHISIGRQLTDSARKVGLLQFGSDRIDVTFRAEGLYLRRLNTRCGQYDIIAGFEFRGQAGAGSPAVVQPSLFG